MGYDYLFLRRPKINYVTPPICEVFFSATGSSVVIFIEPFTRPRVTGLTISAGAGTTVVLNWDALSDALCYTVYRADVADESFSIVAECITPNQFTSPVGGCFRVSAITPEGETDLSDTVCS